MSTEGGRRLARPTAAEPWRSGQTWQAWALQAGIGVALALLLVGGVFAVELAAGWLRIEGVATSGAPTALGVGLGRALLVAAVEETIFRGGLLAYLQRPIGTLGAAAVSSVAFALVHAWNANVTPLAIANLALAGGLFALAYLVGRGFEPSFASEEVAAHGVARLAYVIGRGLPLPIGLHAGWNFFEGSVFGFPVSGSPRDSLLQISVPGPELATGGTFGPEGGLLGLGAILVTGLALWAVRGRVPRSEPLSAGQ